MRLFSRPQRPGPVPGDAAASARTGTDVPGCSGLAVLAGTIWVVGIDILVRDLRLIGWGLTAILLVESLSVVLNTGGWALAFPAGERTVSARRLLAARLAGDAINYLTPTATVGGELLRVRLLGARRAGDPALGVGERGQGRSVGGPGRLHPPRARPGRPATHGALPVARTGSRREPPSWPARRRSRPACVRLDRRSRASGRRYAVRSPACGSSGSFPPPGRDRGETSMRRSPDWARGGSAASLGCFVLGWAVGAAEIYLILRCVGDAVDWRTALALETGSVLIDGMLFFVPAKVGTQEGGKVVLFAALGLSPGPRPHRGRRPAHPGAGLRRTRAGRPRLCSARAPPDAGPSASASATPPPVRRLVGSERSVTLRTLFLHPPSFEGFDGGPVPGTRRAGRSARSGTPPGWPSPPRSFRGAGWSTPRPTA